MYLCEKKEKADNTIAPVWWPLFNRNFNRKGHLAKAARKQNKLMLDIITLINVNFMEELSWVFQDFFQGYGVLFVIFAYNAVNFSLYTYFQIKPG